MLMAAAAYNLKKLLKYAKTPPKSGAKSMKAGNPLASLINGLEPLFLNLFAAPELSTIYRWIKKKEALSGLLSNYF